MNIHKPCSKLDIFIYIGCQVVFSFNGLLFGFQILSCKKFMALLLVYIGFMDPFFYVLD